MLWDGLFASSGGRQGTALPVTRGAAAVQPRQLAAGVQCKNSVGDVAYFHDAEGADAVATPMPLAGES